MRKATVEKNSLLKPKVNFLPLILGEGWGEVKGALVRAGQADSRNQEPTRGTEIKDSARENGKIVFDCEIGYFLSI